MKNIFIILMFLGFIYGCGERTIVKTVTGRDGKDGHDGLNGSNGLDGHSLVSQYMEITDNECNGERGWRLDLYIDMDDSLTFSEGDLYQNSFIVCDISNGNNNENEHGGKDDSPGQDKKDKNESN